MSNIQKPADKMTEEPLISFSHLTSCFFLAETGDDNSGSTHGFPSSREESLYETGILLKEFLKC
jgi:hypothetical protein